MDPKFHQRFNIKVGLDEAQAGFVNRAYNEIFTTLLKKLQGFGGPPTRQEVERGVCTILGVRYDAVRPLASQIGDDFYRNLHAIEAMHRYTVVRTCGLDEIVRKILDESEIDLGIRWKDGRFLPAGAPLLDEKLVNDILGWLSERNYDNVLSPFSKGLNHFLRTLQKPEVLPDVITDMYEALEALAKIVTGHEERDLSANQELFLSKVAVSNEYRPILKSYIAYANNFRHATEPGQTKPTPSRREVESFIYLTGLFLRLAMQGAQPP